MMDVNVLGCVWLARAAVRRSGTVQDTSDRGGRRWPVALLF